MNITPLLQTPLAALHARLGGRMVPFAGYAMPVQYQAGIMAEHLHCRDRASLFDVSHMGQGLLHGADAAALLEHLVPGDMLGLAPGKQRYTLLLNSSGGIDDDLMVANLGNDRIFVVVNAANKAADFAILRRVLGDRLTELPNRALLALQGPKAAAVMARLGPEAAALPFMGVAETTVAGVATIISRSGYTGEDGFEISVANSDSEALAEALLAQNEVAPAGLGARDSLRLEAGLCLHGSDIDAATNPIEAGLNWVIGKRRRTDWNFNGGETVKTALLTGPLRLRTGFRVDAKSPVRAGAEVRTKDGILIGAVTSGVPSPTLGHPIAMGMVERAFATPGTEVDFIVRGKSVPGTVVPMPFVPHRYIR